MFLSDGCSLRSLDPARFNDQMAGRRIIFLGDSLMRGNWQSLACWLSNQVSMNPGTSAEICLRSTLHPADIHPAVMKGIPQRHRDHTDLIKLESSCMWQRCCPAPLPNVCAMSPLPGRSVCMHAIPWHHAALLYAMQRHAQVDIWLPGCNC